MKKFYILLIVLFFVNGAIGQGSIDALPINAFAQRNHPAISPQHPTPTSLEDVQGMMVNKEWKTFDIQSEKNLGQTINHQTSQQRSLIQIYDSIYYWDWDASIGWKFNNRIIDMVYNNSNNRTSETQQNWNGSTWENIWHIIYFYDANSNLTNELWQIMNGAWENRELHIYTYDANNNQTSYIEQMWLGGVWVNGYKHSWTYDANNNQTSYIQQTWGLTVWVNVAQDIYTYDANNNRTSFLVQIWEGNAWVNHYLYTNTYDANNNMTSQLTQSWNGSTWINFAQGLYTYDANNNQTSEIWQDWNGSGWVNGLQNIYTYDANNNRTIELWQNWNGSGWVNDTQFTFTYDAKNNLTSKLKQTWHGSDWENPSQYIYTYDANNFTISDSYKHWNSDGTVVTGGDSTHYYFKTVLGINDLIVPVGSITVYPNPSSGKFTIGSNGNLNSIEIYNLLGGRIYSDYKPNQQKSYEIDLSDQAKGIYYIKIYCGTIKYSRKIVVQ